MTQLISDKRDIEFVMHEQIQAEKLSELKDDFADYNKRTIDFLISEARNFAIKEVLPTNKEGDEQGCTLKNGKVTTPDVFKRLYEKYNEGEWLAITSSPEWGGQGMPRTIAAPVDEYFNGANFPFMMYPGLTAGAAYLIEVFGTEDQKKSVLKNMLSGKWAGTMLLTEPGAGSDVGALTTKAVPNGDGTYSITGEKIFISGGDHDLTENIIHPVLARIEGAPEGTKGISLFLVPKYRINADGSLGVFNDVNCTGIEHKLGIHGNSTCTLSLGAKGNCIGTLLGEENKGMLAMFHMMNEARLGTGLQGFSCASASFMYALDYARQRVQGKDLLEIADPGAKSVPIIQHPDIKRQLLSMKAAVEGMRSLLYYVAYCYDMSLHSQNDHEKERYAGLLEVLTPVAKGYVTDRAFEVCSQGVQVFGGYGYIEEYPMAQLMRDCRITMIYEGTNGIQAMDLLGRKLGLKKGKPFMDLFEEMHQAVATAKEMPSMEPQALVVKKLVDTLGELAFHMGQTAMSEKVLSAFANAHPFLDAMGDTIMAWMHLWRATLATQKLETAKKKDQAFYQGIIKTFQFYVETQVPITHGRITALMNTSSTAVEMENSMFSS